MTDESRPKMGKGSADFKQGFAAGLNSAEEMNKSQPEGSKVEDETTAPLFLRDSSEGIKGNDQDEKDETAE